MSALMMNITIQVSCIVHCNSAGLGAGELS